VARWPRRAFTAQWRFVSDDQMRENRDDLWGRARGDAKNVLLVPDDSANVVMLGRLTREWKVTRFFTTHYGMNDFAFAELGFVSAAL
jgi:hypothetical protein